MRNPFSFVLAALTLFLSVACASMTAEMDLPENLSSAPVYRVEHRRMLELGSGTVFEFGRWQVTQFSRGWTREGVSDLFWAEAVGRTQRYGFVLTGGAEEVDVVCGARAEVNRWIAPEIETVQSVELRCEGVPVGRDEVLFTLDVGTRIGHLEWQDERLLVIPTSELKGSRWTYQARTGYTIEDKVGPVAAVEVLRPGRVWMIGEVAENLTDPLAAVASALLLYDTLLE